MVTRVLGSQHTAHTRTAGLTPGAGLSASRFNRNRTKFFMEAVNKIKQARNPSCNLRVVVVERADANAPGILTDLTSAVPFVEPEGGWTEESARAAMGVAIWARAPIWLQ